MVPIAEFYTYYKGGFHSSSFEQPSKLNQHLRLELSPRGKKSQSIPFQPFPELLADWDLAWDYTLGLDLTFLVFFECKQAHRPTCRGLTPLLRKKRADPMLTDPNLPQLPLPTATSLCSLSLFIPLAHYPIIHPPLIWRGNLHLWLSPDITTTSPASKKMGFSTVT